MVTLFVPSQPGGLFQPILIHYGDAEPVPELIDLESAENFARHQAEDPDRSHLPTVPQLIPSSHDDCGLITLPGVEAPWELARFGVESPGRRRTDAEGSPEDVLGAWLGIRLPEGKGAVLDRLAGSHLPTRIAEDGDSQVWWEWLFVLGGALASHTSQVTTILKDPITGLADRKAFQAVLTNQMERAQMESQPLSLLFINPDQFAHINEQLGRESGDQCVREISERLRPGLRMTDLVARYGGVIFAAILPDTPESEAQEVAQRVAQNLTAGPYLDGEIDLVFSIGLSCLGPDVQDVAGTLEIVRRADRALNAAKRAVGDRIVSFSDATDAERGDVQDRLSGIFTGNMSKDYRNMALLHDTIDILALGTEFAGLAGDVVERLYQAFTPDRIGIVGQDADGELQVICGLTRRDSSSGLQSRVETLELEPFERQQIVTTLNDSRACESQADGSERICFIAPFRTGSQNLGCLFVEGRQSILTLDSADLIFLESLAAQIAVALDRARLTGLEQDRQEQERRRLRAELSELRQALQHVKMVYRSPEMEELVGTVKRVAPTDATVLITGESGTGKELLARTVHELSQRKEHPFVIVDCGAISSTLIESELFGHERGAYTGAEGRRSGRLVEARNGTVLLDEIGELPLEVQSKLLRFVQDKEFTTVGGSRIQSVDVRIVAATNRDLAAEVKAGRFREDLYHRLNVVCLEIPALRERPDDILHLARHFLDLFAVQYQKGVRQFSPEAEATLVRYRWPGNVRELQNKILQSVILSEGDEIGPGELGMDTRSERRAAALRNTGNPRETLDTEGRADVVSDLWLELRAQLGDRIEQTSRATPPLRLPFGTWLRDDLLLEAAKATDEVVRDAAALVGMPESTFRRRLRSAEDQVMAGLATRMETWEEVRQILADLTTTAVAGEGDLHTRTQELLLEEIVKRFPDNARVGAQILGVSPPTYRRRAQQLTSSP